MAIGKLQVDERKQSERTRHVTTSSAVLHGVKESRVLGGSGCDQVTM